MPAPSISGRRPFRCRGGSIRSTTLPCARVGPRWAGTCISGCPWARWSPKAILRGQDIPPDLIIRKRLLAGKSLAQLVLDEDVDIAVLDGQRNLIRLGQDASLTACTWRDYGQTRRTATDILTNTPAARGLRYECRHGRNELALMLIDGRTAPALTVVCSAPLDTDGWARDAVTASLLDDFTLTLG